MSKEKIKALNFIKLAALFMLFVWHGNLDKPNFDVGGRMCELLFIISGFLVAYNYYGGDICGGGIKGSIKYVLKKIVSVWPLHIVAFFAIFAIRHGLVTAYFSNPQSANLAPFGLISFTLLIHAWSPDTTFLFNGVSWFLSAIMFCYFLSPIVLPLINKKKKFIVFLFIFTFALRFFIEICSLNGMIQISIHSNPFVRFLEYLLGMCLVPFFFTAKERIKSYNKTVLKKTVFTSIEVLILGGAICAMVFLDKTFTYRMPFLLIFCVLTFIFGLQEGYLSDLFSIKPLQFMCKFQMELYMLQIVGVLFVWDVLPLIFPNMPTWGIWTFLLQVVWIVIFAVIYHYLINKYVTKGMKWLVAKLIKILN